VRHSGHFDNHFGPGDPRRRNSLFSRLRPDGWSDEHASDSEDRVGYTSGYDDHGDHGDIPSWRQALNVVGLVLMGIGFLLFISVFLSAAGLFSSSRDYGFGSFSSLNRQTDIGFSRAVIGMLLMMAGMGLRTIAVAGLAGSGLVLSAKRARHDLKPWAKMAGGLIDDAVNEVDAVRDLTSARRQSAGKAAPTGADSAEQKTIVKVRCQKCKNLNDEDAKYCDQCGASL